MSRCPNGNYHFFKKDWFLMIAYTIKKLSFPASLSKVIFLKKAYLAFKSFILMHSSAVINRKR